MKSVLLAEDNLELRNAIEDFFNAAGWKVYIAGSLHECALLFEATSFDVIIVDRHLPDGDGASLATHNSPPVIIFSGDPYVVPEAFATVLKPTALSQLVEIAESATRYSMVAPPA